VSFYFKYASHGAAYLHGPSVQEILSQVQNLPEVKR